MAATSKDLVKALFIGKPVSRAPFIPLLATAASRFMQVPVGELFSNPTTLANSLQSCRRLFGYDGVTVLFDPTLEAEACGCAISWAEGQPPEIAGDLCAAGRDLDSVQIQGIETRGRIPVVLEAAKRLASTMGKEVALLGVITGPATLSRQLMGDAFDSAAEAFGDEFRKMIDLSGDIALALLRAYGELKMDGIVLADPELVSLKPVCCRGVQPALRTLRNLAGFYDMPLILQTGDIPPDSLQAFFGLEADAFAPATAPSGMAGHFPPGAMLGGCIPPAALLGARDDVDKAVLDLTAAAGDTPCFITTAGEVPPETPAPNLHRVMQVLTAS
jgi:uroporphyrinogen-III decarboxylase